MELDPKLLEKFRSTRSILALCGAGISAESGVPTFRGKDGLWKNFRAEELASPEAFRKNPVLVWEWYLWRMELISNKSPNPAHYALVELEKKISDFSLITQNVDGLHKKAGSQKITEIHGNIFRNKCSRCSFESSTQIPISTLPPKCPQCEGLLRPNVLWFGENYDSEILDNSIRVAQSVDLVFVIGSSGMVGVPVELARIAKENGSFLIEINLEKSEYSAHSDLFLQGKAGDILPELVTYFSCD